ncbi:MAG: zinc-dependent alcohol dehydrogenase [Rubrobacteraceae bacterium]
MSESTMLAAVFHGPDNLSVEEVPRPRPGAGEVVIKVSRCGICGTDLHILRGDFPAPNLPLIIGHEFAGEVVEVGDGVNNTRPGDKATVDINISCGSCYFCRHNQKLFCPHVRQLGVHDAGGMAEYVLAPATNVYVLPESMPVEAAAYIEPLACAVHGQDRVGIEAGEIVAIVGGGPMGLAHAVLARLNGASHVIVSEPMRSRRELAQTLGADTIVDPMSADAVERVLEATDGRGADVVIEAVGSVPTYQDALSMVRRGGRFLAYGAATQDAEMALRPFDVYSKELTIVGSYAGTYETWPKAIALISNGRFDPSRIVDEVRPLGEAAEAIESLEKDKSVVKIQVRVES